MNEWKKVFIWEKYCYQLMYDKLTLGQINHVLTAYE